MSEEFSITDNNRIVLASELIEIINRYQLPPEETLAAIGMVTTSALFGLLDQGLSIADLKATQQEFINRLDRSIKMGLGEK